MNKKKMLDNLILMITYVQSVIITIVVLGILASFWRPPEGVILVLAVLIVTASFLASQTKMVEYIITKSEGGIEIPDEYKQRVMDAYLITCKKAGVNPDTIHVMMNMDDTPNAFAIGKNYIMVTKGLIDSLTKEEAAGVLAHELGHITNKDGVVGIGGYCMNSIGYWSIRIMQILALVLSIFSIIPFIGLLFSIFVMALNLGIVLLEYFLRLPVTLVSLFGSRQNEYGADEYACKIGLGRELYNGLKIVCKDQHKMTLLETLNGTHPDTGERLRRIADYCGIVEYEKK